MFASFGGYGYLRYKVWNVVVCNPKKNTRIRNRSVCEQLNLRRREVLESGFYIVREKNTRIRNRSVCEQLNLRRGEVLVSGFYIVRKKNTRIRNRSVCEQLNMRRGEVLRVRILHSEEVRCEIGDPHSGEAEDSSLLSCTLRSLVKGNRSFEGTMLPSSR